MSKKESIEDDMDFVARQLVFLTENRGESIQTAFSKLTNDADETIRTAAKTLHSLVHENNTASLDKKSAFNVLSDILKLIQVSRDEVGIVTTEFIKRHKDFRQNVNAYSLSLKNSLSYGAALIMVTLVISVIYYHFILPKFAETYTEAGAGLPALTSFMFEKGIYIIFALLVLCGLFLACLGWITKVMHSSAKQFKPVKSWVTKFIFTRQIATVVNNYLLISYACVLHKAMSDSGKVLSQAARLVSENDKSQLTDVVDPRQAIELKASENYKTLESELEYQLTVAAEKLAEQLVKFRVEVNRPLQIFIFTMIGAIVTSFYLPIFKLGQIF